MRQWLEAGYFKGDLPISQTASGPFHPLSVWFPNLQYAFQADPANGTDKVPAAPAKNLEKDAAEAAEQERRAAEEAERVAREAAKSQREAQEKALALEAERKRQLEEEAAAAAAKGDDDGNEPSTQLKTMLGLSQATQAEGGKAAEKEPTAGSKNSSGDKKAKGTNKKGSNPVAEVPPPAAAPAAPAWGGVANSKQTRKSMSEIQQEEARAAALLAAKRGSMPQSSSGWANVAAGTSGWSSGAIRSGPATKNVAAVAGVRPSQARSAPATAAQGAASRKVAPLAQQQRVSSTASSTPAEEFGTSMPPALESWCKEKMAQITGSDDLTLVGFCMTLNDANEIRQYLVTYLGSTQPVNNFATEFINKRGLGNKQEEWETPGSAKKGRKKKGSR